MKITVNSSGQVTSLVDYLLVQNANFLNTNKIILEFDNTFTQEQLNAFYTARLTVDLADGRALYNLAMPKVVENGITKFIHEVKDDSQIFSCKGSIGVSIQVLSQSNGILATIKARAFVQENTGISSAEEYDSVVAQFDSEYLQPLEASVNINLNELQNQIDTLSDTKQSKYDSNLSTDNKTVVGGINEIVGDISTLNSIIQQIAITGQGSIVVRKNPESGEIEVVPVFDADTKVGFNDYATANKAGVVKIGSGLAGGANGTVGTYPTKKENIDAKNSSYLYVNTALLDYAVKVGVTTNTETLTDEEKTSACEWLGAIKQNNSVSELKQAYVKNKDGSLLMVDLSDNTRSSSIVVRRGTGHIFVPLIPTDNNAATSKNYVDSIGSNWENINISADNIKINLNTDIPTRPTINLAGFKMRYNPTLRMLNITGRISLSSTIAWTATPKFSFEYNYVIAYLQNIIQYTPVCPVQLLTFDTSSNGTLNEGAYITLNDTTFSVTAYETFNAYRDAGTKVFQFSTFIPY